MQIEAWPQTELLLMGEWNGLNIEVPLAANRAGSLLNKLNCVSRGTHVFEFPYLSSCKLKHGESQPQIDGHWGVGGCRLCYRYMTLKGGTPVGMCTSAQQLLHVAPLALVSV
jgi:hypothetical protein